MTKGASNFRLGGRKCKGNAPEPILIEEEWGDLSPFATLGLVLDIADAEPQTKNAPLITWVR